jgi:hypothetical protein
LTTKEKPNRCTTFASILFIPFKLAVLFRVRLMLAWSRLFEFSTLFEFSQVLFEIFTVLCETSWSCPMMASERVATGVRVIASPAFPRRFLVGPNLVMPFEVSVGPAHLLAAIPIARESLRAGGGSKVAFRTRAGSPSSRRGCSLSVVGGLQIARDPIGRTGGNSSFRSLRSRVVAPRASADLTIPVRQLDLLRSSGRQSPRTAFLPLFVLCPSVTARGWVVAVAVASTHNVQWTEC